MKKEILDYNSRHADEFISAGSLSPNPARKIAVLTCMDARLDPAKLTGLAEGDAHVIRNAGGRASEDAIRSLIISHELMGTDQWFIIHHTDCGMENFDKETMEDLLARKYEKDNREIDWLAIADAREGVLEDIRKIREHPLVSNRISIFGFLYHMSTGLLEEIV